MIAAESAFAVESTGLDDAGIGRRLGVDYLLKGSVRRAAKALRLSVQLVQLATGQHLWAERYDVPAEDFFAVQDEIAAKVANALTARIDQTVLLATRRRQITNLAAYECWLRGMECLQRGTVESDDEARTFFEQALAVDPQYARAQAGMSLSHFNEWSCQAWGCWEEKERLAYECAQRAEALDPDDPVVQVILAKIEQYRRQHGPAETRYRRALQPRAERRVRAHPAHRRLRAARRGGAGGGTAASARWRCNPLCPSWYFYYASIPHFVLRDYRARGRAGIEDADHRDRRPRLPRRRLRVSRQRRSARDFTSTNSARSSASASPSAARPSPTSRCAGCCT